RYCTRAGAAARAARPDRGDSGSAPRKSCGAASSASAVAPLQRVYLDAHRAADARAAKPAVAIGILRQVLLVVVLGEVELRGRQDLRSDRAMTRLPERELVLVARALGRNLLLRVEVVDAGTILR